MFKCEENERKKEEKNEQSIVEQNTQQYNK